MVPLILGNPHITFEVFLRRALQLNVTNDVSCAECTASAKSRDSCHARLRFAGLGFRVQGFRVRV